MLPVIKLHHGDMLKHTHVEMNASHYKTPSWRNVERCTNKNVFMFSHDKILGEVDTFGFPFL